MNRFQNKKLLLAPISPLVQKLAKTLEERYQAVVVGYVDSAKVGENIYKAEDLQQLSYDYIIIFSPNHFDAIYAHLKKYNHSYKLYKVDMIEKQYKAYSRYEIYKDNVFTKLASLEDKAKKTFLKLLANSIKKLSLRRELSLFLAEDFVDANIKHMYLYHIKNNHKAILLTNNEEQIEVLKKQHLPYAKLFSWKGYLYSAMAKKIYLDHFILDYLPYLAKDQITIQLWHGVGLKPIRDRSKFHYSYFISPSNWTNETNFSYVFQADEFLNYGYPRNDILLTKKEESIDFIFCDMDIFNSIQKDKEKGVVSILYMPTFRENGFDSFPLDFVTFNEVLAKLQVKLYIKLHPFVVLQYYDKINEVNYSNIVFYNTQGDIYPILKYIDILITDYSSIAYDFLFLNRPIIFFNYDYEEYISIRGNRNNNQFLFDYYTHTPGEKVRTQKDLKKAIKKLLNHEDSYIEERKEMQKLFFDTIDDQSAKRIFQNL